jgi:isoleucyl-tRNA synthetase
VLETRGETLRFPAEVYLEGGDQYRGWFNSSLSCGIVAHDRASVQTDHHARLVVDGEGKKHIEIARQRDRSAGDHRQIGGGNSSALGSVPSIYTEDVRCYDEILSRVVDAYRKFRNDAAVRPRQPRRVMTMHGGGRRNEMLSIDRWALANLTEVTAKVLDGYKAYDFQAAYGAIYHSAPSRCRDVISTSSRTGCTSTHRDLWNDARTDGALSDNRYACRLLSPILVFTSDEAWESIPGQTVSVGARGRISRRRRRTGQQTSQRLGTPSLPSEMRC